MEYNLKYRDKQILILFHMRMLEIRRFPSRYSTHRECSPLSLEACRRWEDYEGETLPQETLEAHQQQFFLKTLLAALKAAAFQMPCLELDCGQLQAHLTSVRACCSHNPRNPQDP